MTDRLLLCRADAHDVFLKTVLMLTRTLTLIGEGLATLSKQILRERLLLVLLLGLGVVACIAPVSLVTYPSLIDWPTIAAMMGLLVLTRALEMSGALHWLAQTVIHHVTNERAVALALVATSGILSMWLTNDVALFLVVPLTLSLSRLAKLPSTKLIIFEALAVNVGSALTPVGNPQNLFLWQLSKVSFEVFTLHMLPIVAILSLALTLLTYLSFAAHPVVQSHMQPTRVEASMLIAGAGLYLPFLIAMNLGYSVVASVIVLVVFAAIRWRVIATIDWILLLTFILMFLNVRLVSSTPFMVEIAKLSNLDEAAHLYGAAIIISQFVSNVPAAIGLAQFSQDWRVLAYGVNIGGFGLMIGSLANLIAIRLSGDKKAWTMFHAYSVPALLVSASASYLILLIFKQI